MNSQGTSWNSTPSTKYHRECVQQHQGYKEGNSNSMMQIEYSSFIQVIISPSSIFALFIFHALLVVDINFVWQKYTTMSTSASGALFKEQLAPDYTSLPGTIWYFIYVDSDGNSKLQDRYEVSQGQRRN